jgi:hypothetical protein
LDLFFPAKSVAMLFVCFHPLCTKESVVIACWFNLKAYAGFHNAVTTQMLKMDSELGKSVRSKMADIEQFKMLTDQLNMGKAAVSTSERLCMQNIIPQVKFPT